MKKFIIVGSAGSPPDVLEILKIGEKLKIPVIICLHFTGSVMETFAQHIANETNHDVEVVQKCTALDAKVYLPEGEKDIAFVNNEIITVHKSQSKVHPSISVLFESMKKCDPRDFVVVVLGGLGDDGKEYVGDLRKSGVRFIIQKNPKFKYLPENISEALEEHCEKMEVEKIRELLLTLNRS
ncbi:MAG TPA: chemotaxis protein CheB [Fervidobacterium sp.]|nr:chemotaxis protein CheB [Fervidobacterium sp.]